MVPPPRFSDHSDDASCESSECSFPLPPPVPPTPLPTPPPSSSSDSHGRFASFVTTLIIAGSALAFVVLCLSVFLFVRRRRQQRRRRREALLEAALAPAAPAATPSDGGGGGSDLEEAELGGVVHHAWHIRTVGLDEAAIESIALTRYRAGAGGVLGASNCAVCLGEFTDGEPLRLLPRCAHAFHGHCIETWLRAHVNCPLCRSHVLDPLAPAAAAEPSDSPAGAGADAGQAASSIGTTELEQPDQQASEQRELRLQIDQHNGQSNSPEQQPHRHTGLLGGNFRRVVSMDSPTASAEQATPEDDEQAGGEKQGTGGAVHCELSRGPGCSGRPKNHRGMKRSLSVGSRWALVSRHCRRSSSLLPL